MLLPFDSGKPSEEGGAITGLELLKPTTISQSTHNLNSIKKEMSK